MVAKILFSPSTLAGTAPFATPSPTQTYDRVENVDYQMPEHISEDAKDLLRRLLVKDPSKRIHPIGVSIHICERSIVLSCMQQSLFYITLGLLDTPLPTKRRKYQGKFTSRHIPFTNRLSFVTYFYNIKYKTVSSLTAQEKRWMSSCSSLYTL